MIYSRWVHSQGHTKQCSFGLKALCVPLHTIEATMNRAARQAAHKVLAHKRSLWAPGRHRSTRVQSLSAANLLRTLVYRLCQALRRPRRRRVTVPEQCLLVRHTLARHRLQTVQSGTPRSYRAKRHTEAGSHHPKHYHTASHQKTASST